jgi:hypothetical protein
MALLDPIGLSDKEPSTAILGRSDAGLESYTADCMSQLLL